MQTLAYSLLFMLPLGVCGAVLFFGSRWQRRQWKKDKCESITQQG